MVAIVPKGMVLLWNAPTRWVLVFRWLQPAAIINCSALCTRLLIPLSNCFYLINLSPQLCFGFGPGSDSDQLCRHHKSPNCRTLKTNVTLAYLIRELQTGWELRALRAELRRSLCINWTFSANCANFAWRLFNYVRPGKCSPCHISAWQLAGPQKILCWQLDISFLFFRGKNFLITPKRDTDEKTTANHSAGGSDFQLVIDRRLDSSFNLSSTWHESTLQLCSSGV